MGFSSTNAVMDSGLGFLKANVEKITVCNSSAITTYAMAKQAGTEYKAGSSDFAVALASTDFVIANSTRAGGGRKLTTPAMTNLTVTAAGNAYHICMLSDTSSALLQVTQCTLKALTTDDTVTIPAYRVEIADPTSDSEI